MKTNNNWLQVYSNQLKELGMPITRLQGSFDAPIFLIAPPPTELEEQQNLAWCSPAASAFFSFVTAEVPLNMNSFLIMPAAFRRMTSRKFRVTDAYIGTQILQEVAHLAQFKVIVCIGNHAFSAYFNRRANMDMLLGQVLKPAQVNYKPTMVFPDMEILTFTVEQARANGMSFRDINLIRAQQTKLIETLLMQKIFKTLERLSHGS